MFPRIVFAILLLQSLACLGKPGDRIEYDITIHENVLANYQNLASGKTDTNQATRFGNQYENRYHLSLSITVLSVENTYTLLRGNISVRSLALKQNNDLDERRAILFRQAAERPFYVKVAPNGKLYGIQVRGNSPASYINFLRDLLSQLQFVSPEGSVSQNSWTTRQEYPDGVYNIRYENVNGGNEYNKTVLNKTRDGSDIQTPGADSVIAWENKVVRSPERVMAKKVQYTKKFYQRLGTTILAYVERTIDAHATEQRGDSKWQQYLATYRDSDNRWPATNIYNPISEEQRKILVSQGVLKKDNLETLIGRLSSASATTMDNESLNLLVSKFRALLFLQPEQVEPVLDRLLKTEPTEASFAVLTAALIEVDTEPAQRALVKLIEKYASDWQVLRGILPALALRRYLSADMEKKLLSLRAQSSNPAIRSGAGLALSSLCRNIGEKDPVQADRIAGKLVEFYMQGPKDQNAITQFLNETGNAGYDKAIEENKKYLHHEDNDTRLRAWYSLRFFKDARTDSLLSEGLFTDTTSVIQQRILTVIHMRPVSAVFTEGILHLLQVSTNEENRELALIWLQKYVTANPGELYRIKARIVALKDPSLEQKFNLRLKGDTK